MGEGASPPYVPAVCFSKFDYYTFASSKNPVTSARLVIPELLIIGFQSFTIEQPPTFSCKQLRGFVRDIYENSNVFVLCCQGRKAQRAQLAGTVNNSHVTGQYVTSHANHVAALHVWKLVQKLLSHYRNEWPVTSCPVLAPRTRRIPSPIANKEQPTVVEDFAHANIETWINMLGIDVGILGDEF
jgi:hypothetical protein